MSWLNKRTYKLLQNKLKDLFYLPRADRKVLFAFSVCMVLLTSGCLFYISRTHREMAYQLTDTERKHYMHLFHLAETQKDSIPSYKKQNYYAVPIREKASFIFDPNTADSTQLLALGFSPWQVRNIYKYRAKGGRFHRKEDLRKIYGMTEELLEHLLPLVNIAQKYQYLKQDTKDSVIQKNPTYKSNKFQERTLVDLNTADTALLKRIPGIGNGFALMIVRRRNQLGGYVSVDQLKEIKNLPDSLLPWFVIQDTKGIRKININKASLTELRRHPYLNFYQCRVILEHRRKFGDLKSLKDLSLYEEFSEKDLNRLIPYCSF